MSENPKHWTAKPMYASWPGRIFWLALLVLPDVFRTFYPVTLTLRIGWYVFLAILAIVVWRMSSSRKGAP
jgi:hypothetical protein